MMDYFLIDKYNCVIGSSYLVDIIDMVLRICSLVIQLDWLGVTQTAVSVFNGNQLVNA